MRRFLSIASAMLVLAVACAAPAAGSRGVTVFGEGLSFPSGLDVDQQGNLYVASRHFIRKYDPSLTQVLQFGSEGVTPGLFQNPADVVVGEDGAIYEGEMGRIQKFTPAGELVFSAPGTAWTLALDPLGRLWGGDPNTIDFVTRYSSDDGSFQEQVDVRARVVGLAIADNGDFWVVHANGAIIHAAPNGAQLLTFDVPSTFQAIDVDADGNIYLGGWNLIWKVAPDGRLLGTFDINGVVSGDSLCYVGDVAAASAGVLYASVRDCTDRLLRIDPREPTAELKSPAATVLTGAPIPLDATGSSVPMGSIDRFEWDLDGDGTYEKAGAPTQTATFATPGRRTLRVRVTAPGGRTDAAAVALDVRPDPPDGPIGVSINSGAQYTNDPVVQLRLVWPELAGQVTVSNDGGFAGVSSVPLEPFLTWKLDESGPERLPKTVYARFDESTQTFQDDIILDQVAPTLPSAVAATPSVERAAGKTIRVALKAKDDNSGVGYAQFAISPKHPSRPVAFARILRADDAARYARVADRAGNWSRWRRIAFNRVTLLDDDVTRGGSLLLEVRSSARRAVGVTVVRRSRVVLRRTFEVGAGRTSLRVPTASLTPGSYTLRVRFAGKTADVRFRVR